MPALFFFTCAKYKDCVSIDMNDEDAKLDVTELKHYLHRANLHSENPALFKVINDIASESNF